MRKVREVLRLRHTLGMSLRQISEATGIGKTVVGEYVRKRPSGPTLQPAE